MLGRIATEWQVAHSIKTMTSAQRNYKISFDAEAKGKLTAQLHCLFMVEISKNKGMNRCSQSALFCAA